MPDRTGYRFLEPTAVARVRNLSLAARKVVQGFIAGLHRSPYRGFSVEFAEHREYCPGDNLRYLDWKVLGRTDRLYIKLFEEETNMRVQLLLDVSGSMDFSSAGRLPKAEYAAYLCGVLSYLASRQQDAIGLTVFDHRIRLNMPARSGPRHVGELLRQLERFCARDQIVSDAQPRRTEIAETLHRIAFQLRRRCLVVLVSDLLDEAGDEAVTRALYHFKHRQHEMLVFHVLDPAEIEFPFRETAMFVDLETQEQIQVDPAYVRDEYRRAVDAFIEFHRRKAHELGADYVLARTDVPYDVMLAHYLRARRDALTRGRASIR